MLVTLSFCFLHDSKLIAKVSLTIFFCIITSVLPVFTIIIIVALILYSLYRFVMGHMICMCFIMSSQIDNTCTCTATITIMY